MTEIVYNTTSLIHSGIATPILRAVDRNHIPQHLTRGQLAGRAGSLQIELTYSPKGAWVEMRVDETYCKDGSNRVVSKGISTTFDGDSLRQLCDFFAAISAHLKTRGTP